MRKQSWVLPDGIDEQLPFMAWKIEEARRKCLDLFRDAGFGLIMPPMIEFLDSLTAGVGADLIDQIVVATDRISGRLIGIRSDITPQAARIDAHAINDAGETRLCYCDSIIRSKPLPGEIIRNPLQVGVEYFGATGIDADSEIISLSIATVRLFSKRQLLVDIGHAGLLKRVLSGLPADKRIFCLNALQRKDPLDLSMIEGTIGYTIRWLAEFYGNPQRILHQDNVPETIKSDPAFFEVKSLLDDLKNLDVEFYIDFGETRGYDYHTGIVFSIYNKDSDVLVARGGRYDDIGSIFGRRRPATGFSSDLSVLSGLADD